ncbi:MAG TPA: RES domain-containing protein [Mucilaginibacter sp.]|jgi:hypothetical protein|nr:RES domain-containing protein [Mucilaginibacter sp.]
MNCCTNCFTDTILKKRLEDKSIAIGNCDFCESTAIAIVTCDQLSTDFDELFDLYFNYPDAGWSLGEAEPVLLDEHLNLYWHKLFNHNLLKAKDVKGLVNQIGRGSALYSKELFEQPVEYAYIYWRGGVPAEDLQLKWDHFAKEIKEKNRFFLSEVIDTDMLDSVFERLTITYPAGTEFYRARISEDKLPLDELGKPPADLTTPGRANPVGIPYLYVSESEKTTLYETRIALHESITIGKFVTSESISLVSLKGILEYGPFEIMDRGFDLVEFIQFRPYLLKLGDELSKPVRKQDVNLDYLPTQYLCEYIKSKLGFDAVEYKSAMNPNGFNLAIFNDHKLKCVDANFYKVTDLTYSWQ